jgi:hypothetical protein
VNDVVDDGDIAYDIITGPAASDDASYSAIDPADVAVVNADDDAAGIDVTPVAGLGTTEAGGTASFSVVLKSEPTADVVIPVASTDPTEGTLSAASLTFTASDWNVPQTVTVTGLDDLVDDGDIVYSVVTGAVASDDGMYATIDPADVAVTNADNDAAGIAVTPIAGLVTSEHVSAPTSFDVVLNSQPTADVVIPIASGNAGEGVASVASLTFTAADWNVPQTVTVTGVDDLVDDGDIAYSIVTGPVASDDPIYAAIDPADVEITNADDDEAGITVSGVGILFTTEAGGTASFTVALKSQPTTDVVIAVASSDLT